jgi:hypothetical protein
MPGNYSPQARPSENEPRHFLDVAILVDLVGIEIRNTHQKVPPILAAKKSRTIAEKH